MWVGAWGEISRAARVCVRERVRERVRVPVRVALSCGLLRVALSFGMLRALEAEQPLEHERHARVHRGREGPQRRRRVEVLLVAA